MLDLINYYYLTHDKKNSIFFLMHVLSSAPVGRSLETLWGYLTIL